MCQQDVLVSQGEALFRRLGVFEVIQHLGEVGREVSKGHALLGRIERAKVLGIDIGNVDQRNAEQGFGLARRHASIARQNLRELLASPDWQQLANSADGLRGSAELAASLQEARDRWANGLLGSSLPAADVDEIMQSWDRALDAFQAGGYVALFNTMDERFQQFDIALQPGEDWGRRPHSPLETWQWILIGIIIGVAVASVIACLWWSGCSWIAAIFAGLCAAVSAASGAWWIGFCAGFAF